MNTLYTCTEGKMQYRIQEFVPGEDCFVECKYYDNEFGETEWEAVGSDALCARIYMRAFLEERSKNAGVIEK